jgi:diaminopimelate decarboxylase
MDYFESPVFTYHNDKLYCEKVAIEKIVKEAGTPVYIYSRKYFIEKYKLFENAFHNISNVIFYAAKSNINLNVIKTFVDMGAGVDVNSEGELHRAIKAGALPEKILLTGVGKTVSELLLGIEMELLAIKAESEEEIYLINELAGRVGKKAKVAVRVNPDVNPQTHPYISTGLSENKFGIGKESALNIFANHNEFPNIEFTGIDMHLGSQITVIEPFAEAVDKMGDIYKTILGMGVKLKHLDIGGGIGVVYENEKPFSIRKFAEILIPKFRKIGAEIFFEPGRYLTANGGILLTEVLYTKRNEGKEFIIVDAGMNDLLRPSIYQAYHHIQPVVRKDDEEKIVADIVGPVCESGDFFGKNREIRRCKRGDLLAIMSTGAYGMVMSSNYNGRRRPAEIMVDGKDYYTTRSRESYEHLLYDEKIVKELHKG